MKKLLSFLSVIALLMISCEGDPGPPGPPGQPGLDGLIGTVFEYDVTFTNLNDDVPFETYEFPAGLEVFNTDVVLAYYLVDVVDGTDVWEPLPRTLYFNDGILSYGFNHTLFDIQFFLDGTVDFPALLPEFTDNLIMRVAILPAESAEAIDVNNMEQVMSISKYNITEPVILN